MKDERGNPDYSLYPHKVTLCFETEDEKCNFMGQLSDGWGENLVELNWPWNEKKIEFHDCSEFTIKLMDNDIY